MSLHGNCNKLHGTGTRYVRTCACTYTAAAYSNTALPEQIWELAITAEHQGFKVAGELFGAAVMMKGRGGKKTTTGKPGEKVGEACNMQLD